MCADGCPSPSKSPKVFEEETLGFGFGSSGAALMGLGFDNPLFVALRIIGVIIQALFGVSSSQARTLGTVGRRPRVGDVSISGAPTPSGTKHSLRIVAAEAGLAFRTAQRWVAQ